ncbi:MULTISPECIES: aldo/keto reductase [Microbacterium]|uniref:Aldo/keto reductase n=1 Tax=Microbacterium wangchenii TaxID=2541726 RepID=A0ABX5STR9_9MICO|nr:MULTISPECIES: aldo/keto reductase [Microbacterium]MCK6066968.1 aldo/keto reductase [Microbacterium sp. EYE_512]QBR88265.1 aldo/keto reductase [Microbacterium wangchenii]TXK17945.1 aldo/keto reductase [Microbacterium wangchenii]
MIPAPLIPLAGGGSIPQLGVGTYKVPAALTADLVADALRFGYRHVDTASLYGNEAEVGEGLRRSGVPREEVFVTTKVWNDDQGYDRTLRAFDASMRRLGMETVDLYLIHWPVPSADRYADTWRALVRLAEEGRARSIGVSNFTPAHIQRLIEETGVSPAVNQVELHPRFPQHGLQDWHTAHGIVTEAWAPLARGGLLDEPVLARIGAAHGKTPAQVVIRWHLDRGLVLFPKSTSIARLRENADVFDFTLDDADRAAIARLETGVRTGRDPDLD